MKRILLIAALCAAACRTGTGPLTGSPSQEAAQIITSDIARFWTAFDQIKSAADTAPLRGYLDAGTTGLKDFTALRWKSASTLTSMVWPRRAYYASVRANTIAVASIEPQVRQVFRALGSKLSDATFPDVYFCIGGMGTGGTVSTNGLLIGTELFSVSVDSPINTLSVWEQSVVRTSDILPAIVAHELTHYQQHYGHNPQTLLEQAIREGSADFVGRMLSGRTINENIESYGLAREAALWAEFKVVMNGTNISSWLYNGGANTTATRPADLGYFVGARITEAYYNGKTDKRQALVDLLRISDFNAFLTASGYSPR